MKTIHMIEDYKMLCKEAETVGKFEAYQAYTQKYPYFFSGVFQYLYCQPIENLKPMIEQVDFEKLLQIAEENYKTGMVDAILTSVSQLIKRIPADFEFIFLPGMELSNIGGCSLPTDEREPHLYIGIDKPLTKEWIDIFVPHELFHMIRHHIVPDNSPETVFSRTIEEGLASYASLWANHMEWSSVNIAKVLGVTEEQADNLMNHTEDLLKKLVSDGEKPLSFETMTEYFTSQKSDEEFPLIGYYLGLYLTYVSVENGLPFETFAALSRDAIIAEWF